MVIVVATIVVMDEDTDIIIMGTPMRQVVTRPMGTTGIIGMSITGIPT